MTDRDHFAAAALTGLLYPEVDDEFAMPYIVGRAYLWADAMLRERCREGGDCPGQGNAANPDAVPAVKAGTPGTGDTPKPINDCVSDRSKPITGPDPDSRVWGTHTPATHATRGECSEQRECTEPVAWAVCTPGDGDWSQCFFHEPHAQRCASAIFGSKNIVPLYRKPTLTDAEREAIYRASQYLSQNDVFEGMAEDAATLRGLLERTK